MRIWQRNHPAFAGLRFLHIPQSPDLTRLVSWAGGPHASAEQVQGFERRFGQAGVHAFASGSSPGITYGHAPLYGPASDSMTCVVRGRVRSTATGGSLVAAQSLGGSAGNGAFIVFYVADSFTNLGWNWGVYTRAGDYWIVNAQNISGNETDLVVAGVYDSTRKTNRIFIDGVDKTLNTVASLGTPPSGTYKPWDDVAVVVANLLDGDVGFVALFDRALSDAEVRFWSVEANWLPLVLGDEDMVVTDGSKVAAVATAVGVRSIGSALPSGGVRLATAVDATLSVGGDLAAEPASVSSLTTRVGVRSTGASGIPTLVRLATAVGVSQVATIGTPTAAVTRVGVRQKARGLPDGRVDLLGGARYRR